MQTRTYSNFSSSFFLLDYLPFGQVMPNRHGNDNQYRYGFNGMERDDEMKGNGNSYTTEFRQLDPRIGRWLSMDPLNEISPSQSPYSFSNNNPIYGSDPNGDICLPCMILNGLLDAGGQVLANMAGGLDFTEAMGEISWTSVGWSMLDGASPGGAAKQLGKLLSNPAIKPYLDDLISMASDAIGEFIDDGDFDVEQYLKTIIFGQVTKSKGKGKGKGQTDTSQLKRSIKRSNNLTKGQYPKKSRVETKNKIEKKLKNTQEKNHFNKGVPDKIKKESLKTISTGLKKREATIKSEKDNNCKGELTWSDPVKISEKEIEGNIHTTYEQTRSDGKKVTVTNVSPVGGF
jgi:RHS repeat-associated protein